MDRTSLLTTDYLDILFQNRNKKYGSYELRQHYSQRAWKGMATVLLLVATFSLIAFRKEVSPHNVLPVDHGPTILTEIKPIERIHPPAIKPKNPVTPPSNTAATAKSTAITIKPDDMIRPDDAPATNADLKNKQIGTQNRDGDVTDSDMGSNNNNKKSGGGGTDMIGEPHNTPTPIRWSEIMPAFNGDVADYLRSHLRYPQLARENNVEGRVTVEFVVNEDGSISNARVVKGIGSGCDEEALRVINSMPHWKPGKQNDRAVKVYLVLPILFQLQ